MRNAHEKPRVTLSPEAQAKLDGFMSREAQDMYLENMMRITKKFSLAELANHSAKIGQPITPEAIRNLVTVDTTMPLVPCWECKRTISSRFRWKIVQDDGSIATYRDGTAKERGQAAALKSEDGRLYVRLFCPVCQETFSLPERAEWQSYAQAKMKIQNFIARRREATAQRLAEEATVKEKASQLEAEILGIGIDPEKKAAEEDAARIAAMLSKPSETPIPAPAAPKKSRKRSGDGNDLDFHESPRASRRARAFNSERDDMDFAPHILPG